MKGPAARQPVRNVAERNTIVEANVALAHWWARRRTGEARKLSDDDAVQVAFLAILRAAELYQPHLGSFATYAGWWIRRYLGMAGHREPVVHPVDRLRGSVSIRELAHGDCEPEGREGDGPAALEVQEERDRVHKALRRILPQWRQVIRLRFGIDGDGPLTLTETGKRLGLTRARIHQIEAKALASLRRQLVKLDPDLDTSA